MKKLIAILIILIFSFESAGYCLRSPLGINYIRVHKAGEAVDKKMPLPLSANVTFNILQPLVIGKKNPVTFNFLSEKSEFMFSRFTDINNKPVAYLVTYPDKDGNLCLRYAIRKDKRTDITEAFLSQLKALKTQCQGRMREDKRFNKRSYKQIHIMLAGAIFQEELQLNQGKSLPAFINTKKRLDLYGEVGDRNLQRVLTELGYDVSHISSYYKLYQHYLGLGLNLAERFDKFRKSQPELKAFISLLEKARDKDPGFKLLGESNLEGVLTGFGHDVSYINSGYKIYAYWKSKDIDIDEEYTFSGYDKNEFNRVLGIVKKPGLPKGKFSLPVSYYLFKILIRLGKFPENPMSSIETFPDSFISLRGTEPPSPDETAIDAVDIALLRRKANGRVEKALGLLAKENLSPEEAERLAAMILEFREIFAIQAKPLLSTSNHGSIRDRIPVNGNRQGI